MSGGGALGDIGIYGVRYLPNEEPMAVRAWARTDRNGPRFREVEDQINWQFRFSSGAIGMGSTSFLQAGTMSWEVTGERGRVVGDPGCFYNGDRLVLHGLPGEAAPKIQEIKQFARETDWMAEVVRGTAPLVTRGEEGLQDMRLIRAILASAAPGGRTAPVGWRYRRAVDPAAVVDVPRPA